MRRLLLPLFLLSAFASAQTNRFPPINLYTGDPTGNVCAGNLIQQSTTTGLLYTCQSGTMHTGGSSGSISPGSGRALPAYPLGSAATVGPSNIAVDVTGNKLVFPSGGAITIPGCTGQAVAADGTGCVSAGGSPGGSNLQFQFNNSAAFGGASGVSLDAATQGRVQSGASVPALTPHSDIRHPSYGATCNGTADDTAAIQAAITAAAATTGSGVVYIPDGCHMANGSGLTNPNTAKQLTLNLQGLLKVDSTFVLPPGVDLQCLGKGSKYQFAAGQPTCSVVISNVYGTLGSAITSTNTLVTVTPTFTGGTIANMTVGSAITIAGVMTCGTTSVTRTFLAGTYPGLGPTNTVFSMGTCTDSSGNSVGFRIPVAAHITISGCSDPTFNGDYLSTSSDFPALTLGTRMVGSATTLGDGSCVITGFNLDSLENARIESVSGSTITFRVNHTHAAGDRYGMVAMKGSHSDLAHKVIHGVAVGGNYGAAYWADANSMVQFDGVQFTGSAQYLTSIAAVFSSSWGWTFERSQTTGFSGYTCPTVSVACSDTGPPFDVLMDQLPQSISPQNNVGGGIWGPNSTVSHGMYVTASSAPSSYETGIVMDNSVIEQPMWNGITFDNRNTGQIYQTSIANSLIQDNIVGWSTAAWVGMSDDRTPRRGQVAFYNNLNLAYGPVGLAPLSVNKYWCGDISINGSSRYNNFVWPVCPAATVTINDGRSQVGEQNTNTAGFTYIPHATKPVFTDPATWGCTGTGCSVTPGVLDPWGGTNAATITAGSAVAQTQVISMTSTTTAAGDVFLYGVMGRSTDGLSAPQMFLTTFGADTFDTTNAGTYAPAVTNLGWHPIVGMSVVKTGAASHTITVSISPTQSLTGTSAQFSQPFVLFIPASEGVPIDEIQRWRMAALHGYVPSNLSGGPVQAICPTCKIYIGPDTNLYRSTVTSALTNVAVVSGTLTVTVPNTLKVGDKVTFSGVATNTWLNISLPFTVVTRSLTQFTASTTHANVTSAPDTGNVTVGATVTTDGDLDARGYKIAGSYGTSGQFLQSTGIGAQWAAVLADPGGNGIVKRTALNTTAVAGFADVVATFASGSCTGFLKSDGTCVNGSFTGVTLTEWNSGGVKTAGSALTANGTQLWSFQLPNNLTSTKVSFLASTADNTGNLYDIGIYSSTGTLLCHIGATAGTSFAPNTTTPVTLNWLASCPLTGGTRYLLGLTAVTSTAVLNTGGSTAPAPVARAAPTGGTSTTVGGVLNGSVTPPADSVVTGNFPQILLW